MDMRSKIVKAIMNEEAALNDYQKFVKEEMKDMEPEDFKDRGKIMKDISKKWKEEKKASQPTFLHH